MRRDGKSHPDAAPDTDATGMAGDYSRLRARAHEPRSIVKETSAERRSSEKSKEYAESTLRALESHIAEGERRLFEYGKLRQRLMETGHNLTTAQQVHFTVN